MPAEYVETRTIALADLTPFPGNARRGNVHAIRESVRANGQYKALVVRQAPGGSLVVLTGNHTREALSLEGFENARCDVVECTDDEATRIVLADNKTADDGTYEDQLLLELLESLDDLDGTGYHEEDYDKLLSATDALGVQAADFLSPTIGQAAAGEESQERAGTDPASPSDTTTLVQVSWLVDVSGREMIRTALKVAQDKTGAENAAAALVAVARDYIERSAS